MDRVSRLRCNREGDDRERGNIVRNYIPYSLINSTTIETMGDSSFFAGMLAMLVIRWVLDSICCGDIISTIVAFLYNSVTGASIISTLFGMIVVVVSVGYILGSYENTIRKIRMVLYVVFVRIFSQTKMNGWLLNLRHYWIACKVPRQNDYFAEELENYVQICIDNIRTLGVSSRQASLYIEGVIAVRRVNQCMIEGKRYDDFNGAMEQV